MTSICNLVVLISGNGTNLQAILNDIETAQYPVSIKAVISNRADAKGLAIAACAGINTHVIEHPNYPDRLAFDNALITLIDQYNPHLVVLAGFMRILTEHFVQHYLGRLMNIHPSLLPKYPGLNTHHKVLVAGDKLHGCTVHFVTTQLDGGPIIIQATRSVEKNTTVEQLAAQIQKLEHKIYPLAIQWFAKKQLQLVNNQVYLNNSPLPPHGYLYHETV